MSRTPLADVLLSRGAENASTDFSRPALQGHLDTAIAKAQKAHPGVMLSPRDFCSHLARHLPAGNDPLAWLASLETDAMFLAAACARGETKAIAALERLYFPKVRVALGRFRSSVSLKADVEQSVREALFLGLGQGREPKIAKYAGRGDLGGWLRTLAIRTALELIDPGREVPSTDEAFSKIGAVTAGPELDLIKAEYGALFNKAVKKAMAALPKEARRDLDRYYFQGMGVEEIGRANGVAVSTVSRRLAKARQSLLEKTKDILSSELSMGARELDSMV